MAADPPAPRRHTLADRVTHVEKRTDRLDVAVFGIPDTDEKGLLGETRETNERLRDLYKLVLAAALSLLGVTGSVAVTLIIFLLNSHSL